MKNDEISLDQEHIARVHSTNNDHSKINPYSDKPGCYERRCFERGFSSGISSREKEIKAKDNRIAELEREFERSSSNYTFMYKENKLLQSQVQLLEEALNKISKHGCCVMHNDISCPGCESSHALQKLEAMRAKNG